MPTAATDRSGIVTPEAVVLEFETAGVGSRLVAGFLDAAVQVALLITVLFAVAGLASTGVDLGGAAVAVLLVAVFLIVFGYPAAFEATWRGRTPGKAALGLRVVTTEGAPIGFRHAAVRAILGLVDWHLSSGAVAVIALLVTKRNQRLGDLVAGTIVLRERSAARPTVAVRFVPPPGLEAYTDTLSTAAIGHDEYGPIRSFLLRAPTLPPAVRADLASQLAYPLLQRLRTTPPSGVTAESFLVCVAAAHQRRTSGRTNVPTRFPSVWERAADATPADLGARERPGRHAPGPAPADTGFVPPA